MLNSKFVKTLVIASTLIGIPAFAQTSSGTASGVGVEKAQVNVSAKSCHGGKFERRGSFGKKLGLTDTQLEKIASLKDKSRVETAAQKAQLKALSDQLKLVVTRPDANSQEAFQVQSKINDLRSQLANEKLQQRLDFMAVLTPEQKETIRHKILVSEAFGGERGRGHMGHHMHHHFSGNRQA